MSVDRELRKNLILPPPYRFHMCTFNKNLKSHCGGDSGGPLMMVDEENDGRYKIEIM